MSRKRTDQLTRRQVLKTTAMTGFGFWVAGCQSIHAGVPSTKPVSANEKLNIGFVGVAHRAEADLEELAALKNVNVQAVCDVNSTYLAKAQKNHSKATGYDDFRKMLENEKGLDAICVATPDHFHAYAAYHSLMAGKHVYCEKPLCRTVGEVRKVTLAAAGNKRVTQMGTQIHAGENYRRVVELIQSNAIGSIYHVHVFCNKSWGTTQRSAGTFEVPKDVDYNLWLGPTADRPYHPDYLPANWRKYWMFGSGTLGDMGCHYLDLAYWAMDLKYPTRISSEGPPPHAEFCPRWLITHWDFPASNGRAPLKLSWYDGGKLPTAHKAWGVNPKWNNGLLFEGEKGALFADYDTYKLYPEDDFAGFVAPKKSIKKSIGHHKEWVQACIANDPSATTCRFDYSGPLSEAVLLGTVAHRLGQTLEWDAANLKVTNNDKAQELIHQPCRKGWEI